jgi:hypothetical protein
VIAGHDSCIPGADRVGEQAVHACTSDRSPRPALQAPLPASADALCSFSVESAVTACGPCDEADGKADVSRQNG